MGRKFFKDLYLLTERYTQISDQVLFQFGCSVLMFVVFVSGGQVF